MLPLLALALNHLAQRHQFGVAGNLLQALLDQFQATLRIARLPAGMRLRQKLLGLSLPVFRSGAQGIAQQRQSAVIGHAPQPFLDPLQAPLEHSVAIVALGLFQQAGGVLMAFDLFA